MSDAQGEPSNIILCGFMGTGKTSIGRRLANRLSWRFVDTDHVIEQRAGRSIKAIFAEQGEVAFRQMEADLCVEILTWHGYVVSTGGGIVLNPTNRENLLRA